MSVELYRAAVLEHSRNPRNAGTLDSPSHRARAANPLCGDELEVTLLLAGGRVTAIRAAVRGCIIAQAGASLMTTAIEGATEAEARVRARDFRAALEDPHATLPPSLEPLTPLLELHQHPSRIGCALLSWLALERALDPGAGT